jgi:hypothetical protein
MSPAAEQLRLLATAVSAVRGHPGFIPDAYLAGLGGEELGHPGTDPAVLAAELCAAGIWERAGDGYRVLDVEAVQVCTDRVRELREQDAWLAGLPDARSEIAVGAAGTTRFGDRTPDGRAAAFRCGECGEIAGVVRVTRTGTAGQEPQPGGEPAAAGWLSLDYFTGTIRRAATGDVLDAVGTLIDQGNTDPATILEVSWTLWDITAFYCPECRLNYCSLDWDTDFTVNPGCHDCIIGTCPHGHRHLLG